MAARTSNVVAIELPVRSVDSLTNDSMGTCVGPPRIRAPTAAGQAARAHPSPRVRGDSANRVVDWDRARAFRDRVARSENPRRPVAHFVSHLVRLQPPALRERRPGLATCRAGASIGARLSSDHGDRLVRVCRVSPTALRLHRTAQSRRTTVRRRAYSWPWRRPAGDPCPRTSLLASDTEANPASALPATHGRIERAESIQMMALK